MAERENISSAGAPLSIPEEEDVGLPGAENPLDRVPILQKLNEGPISRILQTVFVDSETKTPLGTTQTGDNDDLDVGDENNSVPDGGSGIQMKIREIKFMDDRALEEKVTIEPANSSSASSTSSSPLPPPPPPHPSLNDINEPSLLLLSDRTAANDDDGFQDDGNDDKRPVELNLAGDTDSSHGGNASSSSAIVVDQSDAVAASNEQVADAATDQTPPGPRGRAADASQVTAAEERQFEDKPPAATASVGDPYETEAALIADGCRRSNELLQATAITRSLAEHHQTVDGYLVDQNDEAKVQRAFEVELVEEQQQQKQDSANNLSDKREEEKEPERVIDGKESEIEDLGHKEEVKVNVVEIETINCEDESAAGVDEENVAVIVHEIVEASAAPVIKIVGGSSNVEEVADSVKIRPVKCDSAVVRSSELVTRIASYYSTQDEDDDDEKTKRPPVPLKTYQWEDIKRAKQQGGYPWTHLYKPPLGPEDEPELLQRIRTLPKQRKRFEQKLIDSGGSPKSLKRVRIFEEVLVQETEKYIHSLDDNNNVTEDNEEVEEEPIESSSFFLTNEEVPETDSLGVAEEPPKLKRKKSFRKGLRKLNPSRLLKRSSNKKDNEESKTGPATPTSVPAVEVSSESNERVNERPKSKILNHPIVVKLRELARRQIKRTPSKKADSGDNFLKPETMEERQKILQLRESPKAGGREIGAYIERTESDEVVEIVQLEESPGEIKRRKGKEPFVQPDEILHLPEAEAEKQKSADLPDESIEPTISELLEEELKNDPPKKMARRQKEHYYEDVDDDDPNEHLNFTLMTPETMKVPNIDLTLIGASDELMKSSLANQDEHLLTELADRDKRLSDMSMQSSCEDEEQPAAAVVEVSSSSPSKGFLLAPISSVDSASSEDEKKPPLTPVAEESDRESMVVSSGASFEEPSKTEKSLEELRKEDVILKRSRSGDDDQDDKTAEARAVVSSVLDTAVHVVNDRWKGMSDHEYEPVGPPIGEYRRTPSPLTENTSLSLSPPKKCADEEEDQRSIQDIQDEIENRYFALTPTTTGSRTDCEVNTSCVDSSAIEDLPLDRGSRRRWNVGERSKQMQQRFKTGAGKLKTKFRGTQAPKIGSGSPKEKKKFRGPEFTKLKSMTLFSKKQPTRSVTIQEHPTILVSDTTIEIDHKQAPAKSSFASKFKSPDFSKLKEKFTTKSEVPSSAEEVDSTPKTSIFKKFEFKKHEPAPVLITETVVTKEVQPMDTILPESEKRTSESPITPEPPVTPDCYEGPTQSESIDSPSPPPPVKASRFKTPDLSKIKDFKRPEFTKFEFKRPEFHRPKFTKPDMSRFKMPQRFHSLRLKRNKSMKESTSGAASTTDSEPAVESVAAPKKKFEFGTYPRIFSKMRKGSGARTATPPPPIIFTQATSDGTSGNESRPDLDNESGSYQKYGVQDDTDLDRETSVERRMREHFSKTSGMIDDDDDGVPGGIMAQTEEQRQIRSFNEENRAIHEISHARRDEFEQRKPFVHQDSDLVSEDSAGKWAQQMDITDDDKLAEQAMINRLLQHDIELQKQNDLDRRSLPQSNKDTISSGSASDRQRTNVIEEIDDDEFFLRSKGISQDNIRIGEYISSAIREGLSGQPTNSLARVGRYGNYYDDEDDAELNLDNEPRNYGYDVPPPRRPRRVKDESAERRARPVERSPSQPPIDIDDELELRQDFDRDLRANEDDGYFTVGPHRPARRRSQNNRYDSSSEVGAAIGGDPDQRSFYDNESEIMMMDEDYEGGARAVPVDPYAPKSRLPMPPTPPKAPKRKKKMVTQMMKRIEKMDGFKGRSVSNSVLPNGSADNIVVYRTEFEIPPIATPEKFTPIPTPRRSRSRSQSRFTDDDRTSHGAESLVSDAHHEQLQQQHQKNILDLQNKNGYAVIKKDPPPRPPAPLRRKRSTKSLGNERQFNTMPHMSRKASSSPPPPPRPHRNYSTIAPTRPPRTKSISSLGDTARPTKSSPDVTEYEEIGASRDLQSGAIVKKMKDRPLPPPPRPDRTLPRRKKDQSKDDGDADKSQHDDDDFKPSDGRDGGAERISVSATRVPIDQPSIDEQLSIEEMDTSTQTEPLPDDFVSEGELDISPDMKTITPTQSKTLEDILMEEQAAEIERAQQQVAELSLNRGLQRFRDANQRSLSEKSWASRDGRPKTPSLSHLSPHSSALRMNVDITPPSTTGTQSEVHRLPVQSQREELDDNRNVAQEIEKDNNKILNFEVEATPEEEIRAAAEEVVESVELEIQRQAERLENIIDRLSEGTPPPIAPPRRKSSAGAEVPRLPTATNDLSANRMQVGELEVNRLNVNHLNAGNITAQEIQTVRFSTIDNEHGGGDGEATNQTTTIPQEVIDQITERVLNSEQMQNRHQPQSATSPPGFFAIPTEYLNSIPPPSFYQLRDPSAADSEEAKAEKKVSKTEEDPKEGSSSEDAPSVLRLGGQFLSACGSAFMRNVREVVNMIPSSVIKEETRRDMNVILLILIIIIVCLMAFAMGGSRTIHHHHWDFYNPPGGDMTLD